MAAGAVLPGWFGGNTIWFNEGRSILEAAVFAITET
jgi:hypothetical protein